VAQKTRLHTIQTELLLALTWCSFAKTEADLGEARRFQGSVKRIRHATDSLRIRIHNPHHVPPDLVLDFETQLTDLEGRLGELETAAKARFPA